LSLFPLAATIDEQFNEMLCFHSRALISALHDASALAGDGRLPCREDFAAGKNSAPKNSLAQLTWRANAD
jgi:hypothetical protein